MMAGSMVRRLLDGTKTQTRRTGARWTKVKPGDVLHVREAFRPFVNIRAHRTYVYRADMAERLVAREDFDLWSQRYFPFRDSGDPFRWIPAVHMPLDVCRMRLLVKRVWQERADDISEADAIAEGMKGVTIEDLLEMAGGSKRKVRKAWGLVDDWQSIRELIWPLVPCWRRFQLVLGILGAKPDDMVTAIEFEVIHDNR